MSEKYVDFRDIYLPHIKSDVVGLESEEEALNVRVINEEDKTSVLHWESYYLFNSSDEDPYLKFLGQADRGNNILVEVEESESLEKLTTIFDIPKNTKLHHYMVFGSCYVINVYSKDIPCLLPD